MRNSRAAPLTKALRERSPTEWALRLVFALAAAWLGTVAVRISLATVWQEDEPARAHELAPSNGAITGLWARSLLEADATATDRKWAADAASRALLKDPTSTDAAATLGLNAQIGGDIASARRLFAYSQALSRRDLQTQLWAIQDAAVRGDIVGALKHYDIALRTSPHASSILYPGLEYAITDPNVRAILVGYLAHQPSWTQDFLAYLATSGRNPDTTANFLKALHRAGVPVSDGATASLIAALIGSEKYTEAWAYYATMRAGADRRASRDPHFTQNFDPPSYFDWVPTRDANISASIQRSGKGSVFTFAAPPSIGGQTLEQVEMLSPGNYLLAGRSEGIDQPQDARPYWLLRCIEGRELGRIDIPNSTASNGRFGGSFTVPADCHVQVLALNIRPSSNVSGITGQIDWVLLKPAA